jgi:ribosomal protein S18 acetylase RimI-like enzyme
MIALRPMKDEDLERFLVVSKDEYARDRARALDTSLDDERATAERQFAELLKDGIHTADHRLWLVTLDGNTPVGHLWVHVDPQSRRAFIYQIRIEEEHRGKGYGKRTLELLEEELIPLGVTRISLNVFAPNHVARALYEKQGYRTTSQHMQKSLVPR